MRCSVRWLAAARAFSSKAYTPSISMATTLLRFPASTEHALLVRRSHRCAGWSLQQRSAAALWGHASSSSGRTITHLAHPTRHTQAGICLRLIRPSNRHAPAAATFRPVVRHNARFHPPTASEARREPNSESVGGSGQGVVGRHGFFWNEMTFASSGRE
jgi:hypothetical protein